MRRRDRRNLRGEHAQEQRLPRETATSEAHGLVGSQPSDAIGASPWLASLLPPKVGKTLRLPYLFVMLPIIEAKKGQKLFYECGGGAGCCAVHSLAAGAGWVG